MDKARLTYVIIKLCEVQLGFEGQVLVKALSPSTFGLYHVCAAVITISAIPKLKRTKSH